MASYSLSPVERLEMQSLRLRFIDSEVERSAAIRSQNAANAVHRASNDMVAAATRHAAASLGLQTLRVQNIVQEALNILDDGMGPGFGCINELFTALKEARDVAVMLHKFTPMWASEEEIMKLLCELECSVTTCLANQASGKSMGGKLKRSMESIIQLAEELQMAASDAEELREELMNHLSNT